MKLINDFFSYITLFSILLYKVMKKVTFFQTVNIFQFVLVDFFFVVVDLLSKIYLALRLMFELLDKFYNIPSCYSRLIFKQFFIGIW